MALIGPRMNGDALRAKTFAVQCTTHYVWVVTPAGIAQCGEFVDVDTKARHSVWFDNFVPKLQKTMSLKTTIDGDIKKAMLAKNKEELDALRSIKSMILLAETEKGAATELTPEAENKLLMKAAKQRKESAEIFQKEGRTDLAQREQFQLDIISRYLPKQLTDAEIAEAVKKVIAQVGATGPQDMGKVMGAATKALAGQADGKVISEWVKKLLNP